MAEANVKGRGNIGQNETELDTELTKEDQVKDEQGANFLKAIGLEGPEKEKFLKLHPELALLVQYYDQNAASYGPPEKQAYAYVIAKEIEDGSLQLQKPNELENAYASRLQAHMQELDELRIISEMHQQQMLTQQTAAAQATPQAAQQAGADPEMQALKAVSQKIPALKRDLFLLGVEENLDEKTIEQRIKNTPAATQQDAKDVQVAFSFYNSMKRGTLGDGYTDAQEQKVLDELKQTLAGELQKNHSTMLDNLNAVAERGVEQQRAQQTPPEQQHESPPVMQLHT